MIELRFTSINQGVVSPLTLRFGDDGSVIPPVPIQNPTIGMMLTTRWRPERPLAAFIKTAWQANNDITQPVKLAWTAERATTRALQMPWRSPEITLQHIELAWRYVGLKQQLIIPAWGGQPLRTQGTATSWTVSPYRQQAWQVRWQHLPLTAASIEKAWRYPALSQQQLAAIWRYDGDVALPKQTPWGPRPPSYLCSNRYRPQKSPIVLQFVDPAEPASGSVTLRFSNDNNPIICDLDSGGGLIRPLPDQPTIDTTKPITPPRRRSYIMQPELRCYRVSDNQEVNIISASFSINRSSWAATINLACGSRGDKDLLFAGGPQLFKLVINGFEFYGLAEQPSLDHQFGQTAWTVEARSSIAALASPHVAPRSYTNATAKGVAALITDELAGTNWTLDYQMTAFNVPAGAFSYQNKTKMEAIAQVVAAIGGMLYPDGETNTLIVRPRWPVVPWAMASATPDIAVHDDVILSYSTRPQVNPLFNKVFVRGEQQGVSCGVRRTGTAGDVIAPDVVDALITDNQAARMRGTAELADSGYKDAITITLPVMATLPPCLPGTLLGVAWQTDIYKATVDSLNITAERNSSGAITVRQSVGALRSYE